MRAALIDPARQAIDVVDLPDPIPGERQVLIRIKAAGLNRADLAAREGIYKIGTDGSAPRAPFIGGMELAGEIVETGANVTEGQIGDRVMCRGAGYAELVAVDAGHLMPVPQEMSWTEAGGLPLALLTSHDALVSNGHFTRGQVVLINAATSGAGMVAANMAVQLGASCVIATSTSAEKLRVLTDSILSPGCPIVPIDSSTGDLSDQVLDHTDGIGVDLVIDHIGASALSDNLAAARIGGRIVQVGQLGGKVAMINLDDVSRKRLTLVGVTFRTRSLQEQYDIVRSCLGTVRSCLPALRPRVHATFDLADVASAQQALAKNQHIGKLVLIT